MTHGAPWPARRVGDRILCGRPVPDRGYCGGLIATVNDTPVELLEGRAHMLEGPRAELPWGMVRDRPGSHFWRPSNRAKNQAARGQKAPGHAVRASRAASRDGRLLPGNAPALPWTRRCPECNVLVEVTAALLESP